MTRRKTCPTPACLQPFGALCVVEGCDQEHYSIGQFCLEHTRGWSLSNPPEWQKRHPEPPCHVPGCDKPRCSPLASSCEDHYVPAWGHGKEGAWPVRFVRRQGWGGR